MKKIFKQLSSRRQVKIGKQFLPDALEIVEKPIPPSAHIIILLIVALLGALIFWSIFGKLDKTVVARGKIVTANGIQFIQPAVEGTIQEICVAEGDTVESDSVIVQLDASENLILIQNLNDKIRFLELENRLLEEVLSKGEFSDYNVNDKSEQEIVDYIHAILMDYEYKHKAAESSIKERYAQYSLQDKKLKQINASIDTLSQHLDETKKLTDYDGPDVIAIKAIERSIEEKQKTVNEYTELYKADAISKAQLDTAVAELEQLQLELEKQTARGRAEDYNFSSAVYELQRQIDSLKMDAELQKQSIEVANEQIKQAKDDLASVEQSFLASITSLIKENSTSIREQKASLNLQQTMLSQLTLVSPVAGTVKSLDVTTVGGVVSPTQVVASILPKNASLIVEAYVMNRDIGAVKEGQSVNLKLDSFDYQKYGSASGLVIYISPDATYDENAGWIYKIKVEITDMSFLGQDKGIQVLPGMECTVEVKAGERRIIEYFLAPIIDHFSNSLNVA